MLILIIHVCSKKCGSKSDRPPALGITNSESSNVILNVILVVPLQHSKQFNPNFG